MKILVAFSCGCHSPDSLAVHQQQATSNQQMLSRLVRVRTSDYFTMKQQCEKYTGALSIVRRLKECGYEAVFAGGCVRDMLLQDTPGDYDIATTARPKEVEAIFERTIPVGRQFGVMLVVLDGCSYEVATFRSETGYSDGRRPDRIRYAGMKEDAQRRDFTINGMFFDPLAERLVDLVGGEQDLRESLLRTIGEPHDRFSEDYLRLLRAVRFAARLDLNIEPDTEQAIKALKHLVVEVAPERLCDELRAVLTDRAPGRAVRLMDRLGMLTEIFPELEDCRGCEQPENYHPEGDVFRHTLLTVEKLGPNPDFPVAMAALLHDIGKPAASIETPKKFPEHERIGAEIAKKVCRRLRTTRKETDRIAWLVKMHMYFKDAEKMKDSTLRRLYANDGFDQLVQLSYADAMASWKQTGHIEYVLKKRDELSEKEVSPQPLISGYDLLERGYKEGEELGRILEHVYELQLNGDLSDRKEALKEAVKYAERVNVPKQAKYDSSTG